MTASVWGDGTPNEAFEIPPASIILEKSAAYTITSADVQKVIDYIGAGAATITLPVIAGTGIGNGFITYIRNKSAAGTLTVAAGAGNTVAGAATLVLPAGASAALISKGADFGILFSDGITAASPASGIAFTPSGRIAATNVQAAIQELDTETPLLAGSASQVFSVGTATAAAHAMRKDQSEAAFPLVASLITQAHSAFNTSGSGLSYAITPAPNLGAYADDVAYSVAFHATAAPTNHTAAPLIVDRRYTITNYVTGDNFSNVGASSNATGVTFIATGTTPTTWTGFSTLELCPTLDVNGLGAKNLTQYSSVGVKEAVRATDLYINMRSKVEYDGTEFVLLDSLRKAKQAAAYSQTFTANGTWTKPTNLTGNEVIEIEMWGGGGGARNTGPPYNGGGGGAYNCRRFLASALGATETVTVGAGGANGSPGTVGGTSSFGAAATLVSAYGGGGGGTVGGGGGGIKGAGTSTGTGGLGYASRLGAAVDVNGAPDSGGGGSSATDSGCGYWGGGGGGGTATSIAGDSTFGGGGGSSNAGTPGISFYGGGGGANAVNGTIPGGGGGYSANGARGEVRVRVLS